VAEAVRSVLGLSAGELSDDEAIARVLDPARNRYRLDTLNVSYHSPLMRALHHASYTFAKRISHTADSQDQRHRMVPGSRPLLTLADTQRPDVVTPRLVAANATALEEFTGAAVDRAWAAKNRLLALGVPLESALYVLPNAKVVRFYDRVAHRALAQVDHAHVLQRAGGDLPGVDRGDCAGGERHPRLARHLGPPCVVRNGLASPRCTEGAHFCGVPVWRDWPDVERRL